MRLFAAVEVPDEVRSRLADGIAGLRRRLPPARWVRAETIHLTLKFIGERPDGFAQELDAAAAAAVAGLAPVEVRLEGAGFFPDPSRPRVAWLGGSAPGLDRWAEAVDRTAAALGVEAERRPYALHVTLARLDRRWGRTAVETFTTEVGGWRLPPFTAREVVLFASELRPGGAVHTALCRWQAGAGEGA